MLQQLNFEWIIPLTTFSPSLTVDKYYFVWIFSIANSQMVLMFVNDPSSNHPTLPGRWISEILKPLWEKHILSFCGTFHPAHQVSIHGSNPPTSTLAGWMDPRHAVLRSVHDLHIHNVWNNYGEFSVSLLGHGWQTGTRWLGDAENMSVSPELPFLFYVNCKKKTKKPACSGGKKENLHVGALK